MADTPGGSSDAPRKGDKGADRSRGTSKKSQQRPSRPGRGKGPTKKELDELQIDFDEKTAERIPDEGEGS